MVAAPIPHRSHNVVPADLKWADVPSLQLWAKAIAVIESPLIVSGEGFINLSLLGFVSLIKRYGRRSRQRSAPLPVEPPEPPQCRKSASVKADADLMNMDSILDFLCSMSTLNN